MAINVLGPQFYCCLILRCVTQTTIATLFYDMLSGRLTRIVVRAPGTHNEELHGDYVNDKTFKTPSR